MVIDVIPNNRVFHFKLSKDVIVVADVKEHLSIDSKNVREEILSHPARVSLWKTMESLVNRKLTNLSDVSGESVNQVRCQHRLITHILKAMEEKEVVLFNLLKQEQSVRSVRKEYLDSPEIVQLQTLLSA